MISCGYLFSSEKNSKTKIERNFSQYKLNVDLVSNMLFELNCKVFFSLKKMLLFKSLHSNDLVYFDTVYIVVDWVYGRVQLKISHNRNFELKKYLLDLMFQKYEYFMMQFKNFDQFSRMEENSFSHSSDCGTHTDRTIKWTRTPSWTYSRSEKQFQLTMVMCLKCIRKNWAKINWWNHRNECNQMIYIFLITASHFLAEAKNIP